MKTKLLCLLLCIAACLSAAVPAAAAAGHTYTVAEVESLCDGIVDYKVSEWGAGSVQALIDGGFSQTAGVSAEFYIIALSQHGNYNFSAYEKALLSYLSSHDIYSAASREKYALALIASGSNNHYIAQVADEAIGGQGLMSLVFGLHILNNGYQSALYSAEGLVNTILSYQLSDGGWAVIGSRGDTDVTAMTLQALAPYYHRYSDVASAIDRALALLSELQQSNGGYLGMGVENCESAAQVLCALSSLGINQNTDSRFIKNGNTVLDAILRYRNSDGSFAHTDSGFNETATTEAFYAMVAYLRYRCGQTQLYILDNRHPNSVEAATQAPQQQNNSSNTQNSGQTATQASPQNTSSNSGSGQSAGGGSQIIYIDGRAYVAATDSSGRTETVAVEPTQQATAPSETQAASAPTEGRIRFQPVNDPARATDATEAASADEVMPTGKGGYKPYAIGGILLAAGAAAVILFLLKKRGKKHYITIAVIAAGAVLFILLTNFESTESYRTVSEKTDPIGTVTMGIRCDTIRDEKKPSGVPDDCIILDTTGFTVSEGDTAYDVLLEASKRYDIALDNRGSSGNAYIAGISYVYEFDYGDLSGWMYKVNGRFPDVGCQSCRLSDGDVIEWLYTKDIGKDL